MSAAKPKGSGHKIRMDLLCLARDIISENLHLREELSTYTVEDVIEEANKLKAFVDQDQD